MTLTMEHNLDKVKLNQLAKYLGQRSFSSKVTARTHTDTHVTDCSTWTTKAVGEISRKFVPVTFCDKVCRQKKAERSPPRRK